MGAEQAVHDTIFATLLNLPGIIIVHVDIDEQGDCLIQAESTEEGTLCRVCGRTIHTPYGQPFQGAAIFGNFVPPARSNDPVKEGQRCR